MNTEKDLYTVGQVAETLKITVRTLHYWESQGLVRPTERSWSNYRLYTPEDLERLQHILIYRATGMKLADIKSLLASDSSSVEHLRRQRESLVEQQAHLADMIQAVDNLLEKEMNNEKLTLDQVAEILGNADLLAYQAEAEEQYGETDDWQISQQRTSQWSATDWANHKNRFEAINADLAEAVAGGLPADSAEATALVLAHREGLSEYFPVTPAKHYLMSRSYILDDRFRSYYEAQQTGLAQWLADAIAHTTQAEGIDVNNVSWF